MTGLKVEFMEFVVGQRWVSQAEPQLGLGLVVETDGRHITLSFPAVEEDRIYAAGSAPLARVSYQAGDTIHDINQIELVVTAVEALNQINYYLTIDSSGAEHIVPEAKISASIQLSSPTQRLYSGQFDKNSAFQLRAATLHFRYQLQCSPARGLLGPRTNLLRHQIYIAQEVASRYAPRVLLADEVGLGKTIEAGMILHHQLQTGLASRAIIVVPEPLLHQWLVEMLRKFNLHFSLFDKDRYDSLLESDDQANPFESEQLILCSLDLLCSDEKIIQHACAADWDLAIVDEAHHLAWSEQEASSEYHIIDQLSQRCGGLLLLTATPEQLGIESHFARLRLLDPARFHNLATFIEEQSHFVELNNVVSALADGHTLSSDEQTKLAHYIGEIPELQADDEGGTTHNRKLINRLLDRHGTGRVLFRNTRAAIKGFPQRIPHAYPLAIPEQFHAEQDLYPERALQQAGLDWLSCDPRVSWLEDFLKQHRSHKVLLICANSVTATDLEKHLHLSSGIRSAAFYEGLSIIERDRAAAYFADEETGAQVLICSEIGSEGRNFQFAHHLVLFDLPTNADLLEQRIGRLDRIGQSQDIQIHVPFISDTPQEYLYRWYNEGLNAFAQSFSAGLSVYQHYESQLAVFLNGESNNEEAFNQLIKSAADYTLNVREELQNGRDQLLELNSCDNDIADAVIQTITDAERSDVLQSYMSMLFDTFGVDSDFHSEHCLVLYPTDQMLTGDFPGLKEEGVTICFDRSKAQQREEMEFITWENPMVTESIEAVVEMELGNTAIAALKLKSIPAGTLMIECFFAIQCSAPKKLQVDRFLPATPIRVLLDSSGKDLTGIIKHAQMNKLAEHVKKSTRLAIIKQIRGELERMIAEAQTHAQAKAQPLIEDAKQRVVTVVGEEFDRLTELKALNGSIRDEEIEFVARRQTEALACIGNAAAELQAIRVVINT